MRSSKVRFVLVTIFMLFSSLGSANGAMAQLRQSKQVSLPQPKLVGDNSLEKVLAARKSVRSYSSEALSLAEVSQLLWSAQGTTHSNNKKRTAPSAGALYPLEVYLVAGNVEGLPQGVYKYLPRKHALVPIASGDFRSDLSAAALGQNCVQRGAAVLVIAAVYERTTRKYGERGIRYVHMEAGCAAQNIYLQATSANLGTVFVGAFEDDRVRKLLHLPVAERPLALMPVGRRR